MTEKHCQNCDGLLYGVADKNALKNVMSFDDKRLPPIFAGKDSDLSDYLICTPPDTIIAGDYKEIANYKQDDKVAGVTGINHVKKTFTRKYDGPIIRVDTTGCLPLKLTPEHQVLVITRTIKRCQCGCNSIVNFLSAPYWKKVETLVPIKGQKNGDYLLIPRNLRRGEVDTASVPLNNFMSEKGWAMAQGRAVAKNRPLPKTIQINRKTAWLFGLYVAEGFGGNKSASIIYSLGKHEKRLKKKLIRFLIACFGIPPRVKEMRTTTTIAVLSLPLARAFEQFCGHHAENKRVPEFILYHKNKALLRAFADGYFAGDGHVDVRKGRLKRTTASSVSKILALQMQFLMMRIGRQLTISLRRHSPTGIIEGRIIHQKPSYSINWTHRQKSGAKAGGMRFKRVLATSDYFLLPTKNLSVEQYRGLVLNLETEDQTYLANNMIVHNCMSPQCRAIHKFDKKKKILELVRCAGCSEEIIRHQNKWGYGEFLCPKDGSKFMVSISNPHILVKALSITQKFSQS